MRVLYHPDFPGDIRRHAARYGEVAATLEVRFHSEVDEAIAMIQAAPTAAGHFLKVQRTGILLQLHQRCNRLHRQKQAVC